MEKIPIEQAMDKLDMFQPRFGKIDKFGWLDLEKFHQMQDRNLPQQSLKNNVKLAEFT